MISPSSAFVAVNRISAHPLLRPSHLPDGTIDRRHAGAHALSMSTRETSKPDDTAAKSPGNIEPENNKSPSTESDPPPQLPEPPEKPLAGDCCGSGCVRCVWDVYYEELEEYNNQLLAIEKGKLD